MMTLGLFYYFQKDPFRKSKISYLDLFWMFEYMTDWAFGGLLSANFKMTKIFTAKSISNLDHELARKCKTCSFMKYFWITVLCPFK